MRERELRGMWWWWVRPNPTHRPKSWGDTYLPIIFNFFNLFPFSKILKYPKKRPLTHINIIFTITAYDINSPSIISHAWVLWHLSFFILTPQSGLSLSSSKFFSSSFLPLSRYSYHLLGKHLPQPISTTQEVYSSISWSKWPWLFEGRSVFIHGLSTLGPTYQTVPTIYTCAQTIVALSLPLLPMLSFYKNKFFFYGFSSFTFTCLGLWFLSFRLMFCFLVLFL